MIPLTEEGKSIKIFRSSHAPNTLRKTSKEAQLANVFHKADIRHAPSTTGADRWQSASRQSIHQLTSSLAMKAD
jgi:hypothetical protein